MDETFFVLTKGVLALRTNGVDLKWSFGINTPPSTKEEYLKCAVRLTLRIGDVPGFDQNGRLIDADRMGRYHYFSGNPGQDTLYYHRPFMFGRHLNVMISRLLTDEPEIVVNRTYFRYINHRFMNLHSIGYILTDIACLLLLRRGFSPLHCSAFQVGAKSMIVFASPNTGKTLSAMMACMEFGAEFIAEDLAITDGSRIYSVPWTSTFRYYSRVEQSRLSRALNSATKVIPPLELLPLRKAKPITEYVPPHRIRHVSEITHLAVLERGDTKVVPEESGEALRKIVNLNRFEFNYTRAPAVVAYEYFNPSLDIDSAIAAERRIIGEVIRTSEECFRVQTHDATLYAPLMMDQLRLGS